MCASINHKQMSENFSHLFPSQDQLSNLLECYQTGKYEDAEKLAISLTLSFPKHQFAWKVLGAILEQTGRNSEAVNANQKAVALSPQDAQAYYNLGNIGYDLGHAYLRSDAYNSAYNLYTKAIEKNKNKAIYYSARAIAGMETDIKNVCEDLKTGFTLGDRKSISDYDIDFWCNL